MAGSALMLVLCIVGTVSLVFALLSGNIITNIFSNILPLLMLIGMWISYAAARKRKPNTSGTKLIRVPFVIRFVFTCIGYALIFIVLIFGLIAGIGGISDGIWMFFVIFAALLVFAIIMFVFNVKYYKSLSNCMKNVIRINRGKSIDRPSGKFAAVVMFILAVLNFIPSALMFFLPSLLYELIAAIGIEFLGDVLAFLMGGAVFSALFKLISAVVTLAYEIIGGVLVLKFVNSCE